MHNAGCKVSVSSAIGDDSLLIDAAREAGKNERVQRDLDNLAYQLSQGNDKPGMGIKMLSGTDILYARSNGGARLFYRIVDNGVQIVGKSSKGNEQKVMDRLRKIYG